jgi:hypothetical protein
MSMMMPLMSDPVLRGKNGDTYAVSSFGTNATTFGPDFKVNDLWNTDRRKELTYRETFFKCTQHDHKAFNFNGSTIKPGPVWTQPLLSSAQITHYVPLDARRPSSPVRISKKIVKDFTTLVFGHGRFPTIKVVGDPETQDFCTALSKAQKLPTIMLRARDIGGSVGTVGLSWRFYAGKPRTLPHNGKNLFVHEWEDREELIPSHVSEIYQVKREEFDPKKKMVVDRIYWHRRDWTPLADVLFVDTPVDDDNPEWVVDEAHIHGDGFCHFVWIQNIPDDENIDGEPDYEDIYENCNTLDVLNSVLAKGATLNLDPTLVLKMDPDLVKRTAVRKGSENALIVGPDGNASYMELAGTSISVGIALVDKERAQALETAQCVAPDPDTIAAAGLSSVAIRAIYQGMLGAGDVRRTQYGTGIERLLEQQVASSRRKLNVDDASTPEDESEGSAVEVEYDEETGEETPVEYYLNLPPRVVVSDVRDEHGEPTGEVETKYIERRPGAGGQIECDWPEYFPDTATDQKDRTSTNAAAAGGKAVMSHRSAVEMTAKSFGLDPTEEWTAVSKQVQAERDAELQMFPGTGGEVVDRNQLPPGADELGPAGHEQPDGTADPQSDPVVVVGGRGGFAEASAASATAKVQMTQLTKVLTMNELRAAAGVGKLMIPGTNTPDPDGDLVMAEFEAKRCAKGKVVGEAEAADEVPPPGDAAGVQTAPALPKGGKEAPVSRSAQKGAQSPGTSFPPEE